jgi:putative ABC transport system permease protein
MFAVVDGVLLRALPVRDQDRLILAWKELRSSQFAHYPFGGPDVEAVVKASLLLESGAGVTSNGAVEWVAMEDGTASYVRGALVTGTYFEVLGIQPLLGRALTQADDVSGAENVLVISHGLWKRRYGAARDTIGRRMTLGGAPFTIVGVMPSGLDYPSGVEVWRTIRSVPAGGVFGDAARYEIDLIARLRPGVTIDQSASELAAITKRPESNAPPDHPRSLVPVVRSFENVVGATTANVRNLVLIEAVRLAGFGAAAGLVGAVVTTRLMRGMLFQVDPLDLPTLAGAALLLIAASLVAAYVPTRRAIRLDPAAMIRSR